MVICLNVWWFYIYRSRVWYCGASRRRQSVLHHLWTPNCGGYQCRRLW